MGKIVFLSLYDSINIGIKSLQYQMIKSGHESHIIYYKMPSVSVTNRIIEDSLCYEYTINDKLYASNYDMDPWTDIEFRLLIDEINRLTPDVLALSCRSWFDPLVKAFIIKIKQNISNKKSIFIAGGYGPSFNPEHYTNFFDYVFVGEAEDSLTKFMDSIDKPRKITNKTDNIMYREKGELIANGIFPLNIDLSSYKILTIENNASLIHNDTILNIDPIDINRSKYFLLAGRGCVGSCSFCSGGYWRSIYSSPLPKRRNRSLSDICSELEEVASLGFKYIQFIDEYFVFSRQTLFLLFDFMEKKIQLPFFCYLHPQMVVDEPEILHKAVRAGMTDTIIAFQSGSEEFSKQIYNRRFNIGTLCSFANLIHSYRHVSKKYHFITGNPLEPDDVFFKTLELIKRLPFRHGQDTINAFKLNVFPRSPLGELFKAKGVTNEVSTKRSFTYGLLHYLRVLVDDRTMNQITAQYKNIDNPFELQKIVHNYENECLKGM